MSELIDQFRRVIEQDLTARRTRRSKPTSTPRLAEVRLLTESKLFVRFRDGVQGVYDVEHLGLSATRAIVEKSRRKRAAKKLRPRKSKA